MAQYKTGAATVTNGSNVVTFVGAQLIGNNPDKPNVSPGNMFRLPGGPVHYLVNTVDSDLQLTLTTVFAQPSVANSAYSITRDFTPVMGIPEVKAGDSDVLDNITEAFRRIDTFRGSGNFLHGTTEPPAASLGAPNDYYFCTGGSFNLYGPKSVDGVTWPAPVCIRGIQGIQGLTGNPYKAYATKALATADLANIPADALIWVNADSTPANNGNYAKTGGALVPSSFDRTAAIENTAAFPDQLTGKLSGLYTDPTVYEHPRGIPEMNPAAVYAQMTQALYKSFSRGISFNVIEFYGYAPVSNTAIVMNLYEVTFNPATCSVPFNLTGETLKATVALDPVAMYSATPKLQSVALPSIISIAQGKYLIVAFTAPVANSIGLGRLNEDYPDRTRTLYCMSRDVTAMYRNSAGYEQPAFRLKLIDAGTAARFTAVEGRATALEGRATAVEGRATALEGRATAVEGRATALEATSVVSDATGKLVGLYVDPVVYEHPRGITEMNPTLTYGQVCQALYKTFSRGISFNTIEFYAYTTAAGSAVEMKLYQVSFNPATCTTPFSLTGTTPIATVALDPVAMFHPALTLQSVALPSTVSIAQGNYLIVALTAAANTLTLGKLNEDYPDRTRALYCTTRDVSAMYRNSAGYEQPAFRLKLIDTVTAARFVSVESRAASLENTAIVADATGKLTGLYVDSIVYEHPRGIPEMNPALTYGQVCQALYKTFPRGISFNTIEFYAYTTAAGSAVEIKLYQVSFNPATCTTPFSLTGTTPIATVALDPVAMFHPALILQSVALPSTVSITQGNYLIVALTAAANTLTLGKLNEDYPDRTRGLYCTNRDVSAMYRNSAGYEQPAFRLKLVDMSIDIRIAAAVASTTPMMVAQIEKYTYGAKMQNCLKKLRDFRAGRYFAVEPKIIILGDSITGGAWSSGIKTWLETAFNLSTTAVEIHWYGGYSTTDMLAFIDEVLIFPNPDLIIFNEYEDSGTYDHRLHQLEMIIQLILERTTADIAIGTWSMNATTADALYSGTSTTNDSTYQDFNYYRDISRIYNCELIDFNEAIKRWILAGNNPAGRISGPHPDVNLYNSVFLPEIKKHFNDSDWQASVNMPYPVSTKSSEEMVFCAAKMRWELFGKGNVTFDNPAYWTTYADYVASATAAAYVTILAKDIIGFDVFTRPSAGAYSIAVDGGAGFVAPSSLTLNGRPLQYSTEIRSTTYATNDDLWRMKRPFKKCVVNSNVLANATLTSGQYLIKVTDVCAVRSVTTGSKKIEVNGNLTSKFTVGFAFKINGSAGNNGSYAVAAASYNSGSGRTEITTVGTISSPTSDGYITNTDDTQIVSYQVLDPAASVLGTGIVGFSSLSIMSGAITFPLQYNGEANYYLSASGIDNWGIASNAKFEVNETYAFYIKSNWIDAASTSTQKRQRIFGFSRGDYIIKITVSSGMLNLYGVKLLH